MLAKEIMNRDVITVQAEASIEELARILSNNKISGAPVVDQEGNMVGIVTEGDLLHREITPRTPAFVSILGAIIYIKGVETFREDLKKFAAVKTSEIMTTGVVTVNGDTEVEKVAALMVEHGIKRVPVLENGRLAGIISRADIVRTLAGRACE